MTGVDVLSAPEVTALENSGRELRSRVDRAQERTSKLLKKLESARDELGNLRYVIIICKFLLCIVIDHTHNNLPILFEMFNQVCIEKLHLLLSLTVPFIITNFIVW